MALLKSLCDWLDLEKSGTKDSVVARIMAFLLDPQPSGKALPNANKGKSESWVSYDCQSILRKSKLL